MSLRELEAAVEQLPKDELSQFRSWFEEFEARWDQQIEQAGQALEAGQRKQPRPFGLAAGEFVVPDDFDAPLPEEALRDFEGA